MIEQEWDALVRRLDEKARADPSGYRLRVGALALLGYGFLLFSVLVLLGLAGLVVVLALAGPALLLKLLIPIGALILVIARSLWIRVEPPTGLELKRGDAPELDELIATTRAAVEGPKVHKILVDGDLNAAVTQVPRFGVFGGQRNYLMLGLPLLQTLTPDEFRAVLAHELGHLSKSHGRFGTWIYRVRRTWWKLLDTLEEQRRLGTGIFRRFFEWYAPYFNAYSFALARAHEFEADRAAVAAAGAPAAATALARLNVAGRHLHGSYWPKLYEGSMRQPEPPRSAFAPLGQALRESMRHPDATDWVDEDLRVESGTTDTHPSLADRLEAIGVGAEDVKRSLTGADLGETAAQRYLGAREANLVEQLDRDWFETVATPWRERYEQVQVDEKRIVELQAQATLSDEELAELATLTWDTRGDDEALPHYRALLERDAEHAAANFALGRILLAREDEAGLRHLDAAIEADPEAALPAAELALDFLKDRDRPEDVARYEQLGQARYDQLQLAEQERADVTTGGELVEHDLSPELVEETRRQLAEIDDVKRALLVRRTMRHLNDEFPLYVLFVAPARKLWRPLGGDRDKLVEKVVHYLNVPYVFWVLSPGAFSSQLQSVARIPKAEIYRSD